MFARLVVAVLLGFSSLMLVSAAATGGAANQSAEKQMHCSVNIDSAIGYFILGSL